MFNKCHVTAAKPWTLFVWALKSKTLTPVHAVELYMFCSIKLRHADRPALYCIMYMAAETGRFEDNRIFGSYSNCVVSLFLTFECKTLARTSPMKLVLPRSKLSVKNDGAMRTKKSPCLEFFFCEFQHLRVLHLWEGAREIHTSKIKNWYKNNFVAWFTARESKIATKDTENWRFRINKFQALNKKKNNIALLCEQRIEKEI